jgi:2-polyprenyl-3-methyl-5-hydroxy-6-metoxy-1,4-benzoquinol methylase
LFEIDFLYKIKSIFYVPIRYSDFNDLENVLCKYIKARDEVLIIGCGNSTLSSDLYDTGIEHITNIDLSEKVIKQMKKQNEKRRVNMKWLPMDARQVC